MKKKIFAGVLTLALAASVLGGCTGNNVTTTEEATEVVTTEATTEAIDGRAMTDRAGNDIIVPEEVETIASMSPSTTELLISMGLADKIVACDTYSAASAFAGALNDGILNLDMMAPDNEALVDLNPDIVFTTGMSYADGDDVYAASRDAGICIADLPTAASLQDIEDDIAFIGECVGAEAEAQDIIDEMKETIDELKACAEGIENKKTVLYVMSVPTADYPDVYTCGKGTYMDEIFTLVGLTNVAGDIDSPWPSLSEEDILNANPDIIICGDTYTENPVEAILAIDAWHDIEAIENKAVFAIDGDSFNQPNQFVLLSALEIAQDAYPDDFNDVTLEFEGDAA